MSTPALAPSGARGLGRVRTAPSLFDDLGGAPTLDEVLAGAWEGLAVQRSARCPVCSGEMTAAYDTHAPQPDDSGEAGRRAGRVPEGGRCRSCDTALS